MLTPELTPCLRAHTFSFYADAYAGLHTPGFCLREVRIASPLLKMDNCVLNVIGIPAMELPTIQDMYHPPVYHPPVLETRPVAHVDLCQPLAGAVAIEFGILWPNPLRVS